MLRFHPDRLPKEIARSALEFLADVSIVSHLGHGVQGEVQMVWYISPLDALNLELIVFLFSF